MKFSADRSAILAPLQAVIGVVERRQTMPILANVLITGRDDQLLYYSHGSGSRIGSQNQSDSPAGW